MSAEGGERRLGEQLHDRLRSGDLTASEEIEQLFFPRLPPPLRPRRPEQFKPESLALFSYLKMAAFGDLSNAVASRAAQNMRVVELSEERPEHMSDQGAVEDQLIAGFSSLPDRLH